NPGRASNAAWRKGIRPAVWRGEHEPSDSGTGGPADRAGGAAGFGANDRHLHAAGEPVRAVADQSVFEPEPRRQPGHQLLRPGPPAAGSGALHAAAATAATAAP